MELKNCTKINPWSFSPGVEFSRLFFFLGKLFLVFWKCKRDGGKTNWRRHKKRRLEESRRFSTSKTSRRRFSFAIVAFSTMRCGVISRWGKNSFTSRVWKSLASSTKRRKKEKKVWKKNIPIAMLMGPLQAYYPFKGSPPKERPSSSKICVKSLDKITKMLKSQFELQQSSLEWPVFIINKL